MDPVAVPNLDEIFRDPGRVRGLSTTAIAALLIKSTAVQNALAAELVEISAVGREAVAARAEGDQLLTVGETAELLNSTKDWVYRHAAKLPFVVRIGGQLRFSADGLQRYIHNRTIKPAV